MIRLICLLKDWIFDKNNQLLDEKARELNSRQKQVISRKLKKTRVLICFFFVATY